MARATPRGASGSFRASAVNPHRVANVHARAPALDHVAPDVRQHAIVGRHKRGLGRAQRDRAALLPTPGFTITKKLRVLDVEY